MKKNKGTDVNLLYKTDKKRKSTTKKSNSKKQKKTNTNSDIIDLNNEIIIGMTPKLKKQKNVKTKNPEKKTKQKKLKNKSKEKQKTKKKASSKFAKILILVVLLVLAIILFLLSDIFNIKEIKIENNEKVTEQEIINLSELKTSDNMFKINKNDIKEKIKKNAYIADVKIKRNLLGTITINIKERKPKYMLEIINAYAYLDSQGYILDITSEAKEIPILEGITTNAEEIKAGQRLLVEDLKKLDDINQIMENAKSQKVSELITKINIADNSDYVLTLASKEKNVHFGDITDINTKMLLMISILEKEEGSKGDIYLNNGKKAFFRESIN